MPRPGSLNADHHGGKERITGKRKHAERDAPDPSQQQTTISDLFGRSKDISPSNTKDDLPPARRVKSSSSSLPTSATERDQHPILSEQSILATMYSFGSSSTASRQTTTNTIDLTSSSSQGAPLVRSPRRPVTFAPQTGAKKLTIKLGGTRKTGAPSTPHKTAAELNAQVRTARDAVLQGQRPAMPVIELYHVVENLCRHGHGRELADELREACANRIGQRFQGELAAAAAQSADIQMLQIVTGEWTTWIRQLATIEAIYAPLNQSLLHISATSDEKGIHSVGTHQFRTALLASEAVCERTLRGVCSLIDLDRQSSQTFSSELLEKAIQLFYKLGIYHTSFEPMFIESSKWYYEGWAAGASKQGLATYARGCGEILAAEAKRCNVFGLDNSTGRLISSALNEILVSAHKDLFFDTEKLMSLYKDAAITELGAVYTLLSRINQQISLKESFCKYIDEAGTSIIFDEEREEEMVHKLLIFNDQLDRICDVSFKREDEIKDAARLTFTGFMNKTRKTEGNWGTDNSKPGEMIAKYVDLLLRGGAKFVASEMATEVQGEDQTMVDPEEQVNKQLDKVLELFRHVHGKAVFEAFYKNNLARRLLLGRSASDDAEKGMLNKLRTECGTLFTQNLESMFRDIELAREEMNAYKATLGKTKLDFDALVLSAAAWPSYPDAPANVPQSVKDAIDGFTSHYKLKHTGKGLSWKHSLAFCQLRANFPLGRKDLVVSGFQAIILLLFNDVADGQTLSYADIKTASGLSTPDVTRTLQSLACGRYRVLTKTPKSKSIAETDVFSYNQNFTDIKMRIKINQIQLKETKEENKQTHERVAADRHLEAQAAIVRIMKSRKEITHAELIVEVINATRKRGVLEPAEIKKEIEKLIEKDYLEREGTGYTYIA